MPVRSPFQWKTHGQTGSKVLQEMLRFSQSSQPDTSQTKYDPNGVLAQLIRCTRDYCWGQQIQPAREYQKNTGFLISQNWPGLYRLFSKKVLAFIIHNKLPISMSFALMMFSVVSEEPIESKEVFDEWINGETMSADNPIVTGTSHKALSALSRTQRAVVERLTQSTFHSDSGQVPDDIIDEVTHELLFDILAQGKGKKSKRKVFVHDNKKSIDARQSDTKTPYQLPVHLTAPPVEQLAQLTPLIDKHDKDKAIVKKAAGRAKRGKGETKKYESKHINTFIQCSTSVELGHPFKGHSQKYEKDVGGLPSLGPTDQIDIASAVTLLTEVGNEVQALRSHYPHYNDAELFTTVNPSIPQKLGVHGMRLLGMISSMSLIDESDNPTIFQNNEQQFWFRVILRVLQGRCVTNVPASGQSVLVPIDSVNNAGVLYSQLLNGNHCDQQKDEKSIHNQIISPD